MVRKLGVTGMDSRTELEFRAAFEQIRTQLGGRWELAADSEADHVVVDMDSTYGPMSWIRLHGAGKQVIGLTTSARTRADHRLSHAFDPQELAALLSTITGDSAPPLPLAAKPPLPPTAAPVLPQAATSPAASAPLVPAAAPRPPPPPLTGPVAAAALPVASTPAPAPADLLPEEQPMPVDREAAATPEPAASLMPNAPAAPEPEPVPGPAATVAAAASDTTLADLLAPGALTGRWRHRQGDADVVLDADARVYHGPSALKPLSPLFQGGLRREQLQALDQAAWSAAATGAAQPLSRLQWFGALQAGNGALLPGNDPQGKYRLLKWPQTEREFPKHFRIATAMMKGPATLPEIAGASGVTREEVADFINASLATGYAESVSPVAAEPPATPQKPAGLFGRLRGR